MKKLLVYLRDYRRETVLGPLFKLLEAAFELLVPLVMAAVIDRGIGGKDTGFILRMCLLLVGLGALGVISSVTAQYFAAKAAAGFGKRLRHALFDHLEHLSFTELDHLGGATLVTRMTSDMNQAQNGVNMTLRLLLRSPMIVFGAMIMAFTIDAQTALVFVVSILALGLLVSGIMLWSVPRYQKVQARLDSVLGSVRENLSGARVLRAFCLEDEEARAFAQRNGALTRMQVFVGRVSALMNPVTYALVNLAIVWLVWTGALRVDAGMLTQGAVVALYSYMSQILVELIKLANLILTLLRSVACGNRIQAVFEVRSSMINPTAEPALPENAPAITFDNASLTYQGAGAPALAGLTLTVRRGQTVGVIGGTGSGKSTLVGLIPRFYDATEGRVLVDGVDVKDYPLQTLRGKIGVVPQQAALFQGTLRENLRWGKPDATDAEMDAALRAAQALEVAQAKGGLDFVVEQGGRNLSGGQRQRITIARALVREPEILILDDSASALDYVTDAALRKAIRELPSHPTVLVVSQRASAVQQADVIVVLEDGAVAGIGTGAELLRTCAVYREIYNSQFRQEDAAHA